MDFLILQRQYYADEYIFILAYQQVVFLGDKAHTKDSEPCWPDYQGHWYSVRYLLLPFAHIWLVEGRKLLRSVINSCMSCRKEKKRAEEQIMSRLPDWKSRELQDMLGRPSKLWGLWVTAWTLAPWPSRPAVATTPRPCSLHLPSTPASIACLTSLCPIRGHRW